MSARKVMIRCDIEGVSGVVSYAQAEPGKPEFEFGLRMFRSDLMACVEGLLEGGTREVVIYDEHYWGRNVDPAWLPDGVSVIAGKPPYRADWAGGLDNTFDGVVLLGFHSMYGTGAVLHHSYELDIRELRLNGTAVGEIGMEAAVAGDLELPVLLVTADSAGVAEAAALMPGVHTVTVKESLGEIQAHCPPLHVTAKAIRTAAREAVATSPSAEPFRVGREVVLEVRFNPGPYLESLRRCFPDSLSGDGPMVIKGGSAAEVWAVYWQRKLQAQGE